MSMSPMGLKLGMSVSDRSPMGLRLIIIIFKTLIEMSTNNPFFQNKFERVLYVLLDVQLQIFELKSLIKSCTAFRKKLHCFC